MGATLRKPIVATSDIVTDADTDLVALGSLKPGDWVPLRRKKPSGTRKSEVVLCDGRGRRLGRISAGLEKSVGLRMDAGWRTACLISRIIAGSTARPEGSVIVFCYPREDEDRVRSAVADLAARIRAEMRHRRYVAAPLRRSGETSYGLPASISAVEEPAYQSGPE